ncbi:MAG: hypothetical protein DKM50_03765 [Candidatus Margulisiibacteriota bacterium]|nr:MAG: hypothetical protein A2X43_01480 [Candidatus Margulisbacteria bacterium GWD2_39_127]OGI04542.1 MAG: hypothetical protein A2X42_10465 [Candidatus Margulisbacteria bacterium GWF2_38_17]OGI07103.1 MAG: hypothetical protein A2X41_12715 [Candidatus Margulisbacteria bacterium GWE2_39_32]PZM82253.1 MAG: hypothetical protein DKM50_03765 [Candidatus Margulisiibacteriota bacterium]HAR63001.1 hypothetical protein [Candidatus Margulisiibacteriota bacterium]
MVYLIETILYKYLSDVIRFTFLFFPILIAGKLIITYLGNKTKKILYFRSNASADRIIKVLKRSGMLVVTVSALRISFFNTALREIPKFKLYVSNISFVLNVILIAQIIYIFIDVALEWYACHIAAKTATGFDKEFLPLIRKGVLVIVLALSLISIMSYLGYNVVSLIATFGVASLAIGLAAQETLANMISGFVILIDRPFRVGDRIQYDNDLIGDVMEIGLRSTRILKLDNTMAIIPNSSLGKNKVINFSYPDTKIKIYIAIDIAYGSDIKKVKEVITMLAANNSSVLPEPLPQIYFRKFAENCLKLILECWINNYNNIWIIEDELHIAINEALNQREIESPYSVKKAG